jgi:2-polyprenyl-6-methoxyphenol hydroxylase-like FAD-dependent oxidoreductase
MSSSSSPRRRALVVGLGISGIAAATSLHAAGWESVIVERAAQRRAGGYFIALHGAGRHAARRLGAGDRVHDRSAERARTYEMDRAGRHRHRSPNFADLPGRPWVMLRGDVEQALFDGLPGDVEIRYSAQPTQIEQDDSGTTVTITNTATNTSTTERFDLVVGADGLRSAVRLLVFGPHEQFLRPLGYVIGAALLDKPITGLGPHDGLTIAEPGRAAWVFGFGDRPQTVLFTYRPEDVDAEFTRPAIDSLRAAFGPEPTGQVLGELLDQFEATPDYLFDSTHQVKMPSWHNGRVVLVGDAAWCPTLYSGMGASSGLAGADLLGAMLERHPNDLTQALTEWETTMRHYVDSYQDVGLTMRSYFVPATEVEWGRRARLLRLLVNPIIRSLFQIVPGRKASARMKDADIIPA